MRVIGCNHKSLERLFNDEVVALRRHQFIDAQGAAQILRETIDSQQTLRVHDSSGLVNMYVQGRSLFETMRSRAIYAQSNDSGCSDGMSQCLIDLRAAMLKTLGYTFGQTAVPLLSDRNCPTGVFRSFQTGGEAPPHQDDLSLPEYQWAALPTFVVLLSVLVYLEVPCVGGQLEIWNESLPREQYIALRQGAGFGPKTYYPSAQSLCLKPMIGDLVVFNALKMHRVRPWVRDKRSTFAFFAGMQSHSRVLQIFS